MGNAVRRGALVLAAGKGTRMKSATPKVMHSILEEPMISYPLRATLGLGFDRVAVVVGFGGEEVQAYLQAHWPQVEVLWQREQLGTGHAVMEARDWWQSLDELVILYGDMPCLTPEALGALDRSAAEGVFLSFRAEDPRGYGRVVRGAGTVRIVEDRDATSEELRLDEVNSGIYRFSVPLMAKALETLSPANQQGEYYLTDVVHALGAAGRGVDPVLWPDAGDLEGVNDPRQLAAATALLRDRILGEAMGNGVRCPDPSSVWVGPEVVLEEDVFLAPQVQIFGKSRIGAGSTVGSGSILRNAEVGRSCRLMSYVCLQDSVVRDGVSLGPFVVIRDGSCFEAGSLAGKFVEVKKSTVGRGSKVPHLSYLGDATVGEKTNIGAGTITCNYDGVRKNATIIGDRCFVGSDTMLVAPVRLDDDVTTGAGSVITQDVPSGALAVGRARQRNVEGWKARHRAKEEG